MDEQPQGKRGRTVAARRQRSALAASLAVHGLIVWALLASWLETPAPVEPQAMIVALLQLDAVAPKPAPAPKAKAATPAKRPRKPPANASPRKSLIRRTPSPRPTTVEPIPAAEPSPVLTAAQLAGAAVAGEDGGGSGSGGEGGGRRCDMAARVQNALRRDPLVRAAMTSAAGSATLVMGRRLGAERRRGRQGTGRRPRGHPVGGRLRAAGLPHPARARPDPAHRDRSAGTNTVGAGIICLALDRPADAGRRQARTITTTRRFWARPARVVLGATGASGP